ncbi:hypothetical protein NEOLEDRAFT_400519 [Neolentinus lepideus HHB14362 ss-1]|uniref:Uncharacterized protein n=1 Tax=Neolentinus lepideus HHB14362 ss-1 TaxID=1314782 RepID=A0A165SAJ9_9AGAM|nr:hypothetical protein NEOLEDRAFT_400519 [Neolentinus lepideus HHB14362 ss-1]
MQLIPYSSQGYMMGALEPLDHMPFPPPFGETPKRGSAAAVDGGLNDTPSSESWSLPSTPILAEPILPSDQPVDAYPEPMDAMSTQDCPAAPVMKDMDSFSQGTGQGSFEFSMKDGAFDEFERTSSIVYNPAHPEISIENWRRDVCAHLEEPGSSGPACIPLPTTSALGLRPKRGHSSSGSDFSGGEGSCESMQWRKHKEAKRRRVMQNELPVIDEGSTIDMSQWDWSQCDQSRCAWGKCNFPDF